MIDYAAVLTHLYPEAEWSLNANDPAQLSWSPNNADPAPTQAELDQAWPAVRDAAKWAAVRVYRDRLLAKSDWTQIADAPLTSSQKQGWAGYRQALRDVPQTQNDPDNIVWPEAP